MKNTPGILIQARTRSTRLPGKILLPFYNDECILEIILKNLLKAFKNIPVIVATSSSSGDDEIIRTVKKFPEAKIFRGDEENVLRRFADAADYYNLTSVIRICSDNPFTDPVLVKSLISFAEAADFDYVSYKLNGGLPVIKSHQGFYAEWSALNTLRKIFELTDKKTYYEHVTNYIYGHPEIFNVHLIPAPTELYNLHDLRLTIDTPSDFRNAQFVYSKLIESKKENTYNNVLEIVLADKELLDSMKHQINLNSK
jgi:spore coat polysaccharide biosynthesis protein SpsF (cytidylyltransferase family)